MKKLTNYVTMFAVSATLLLSSCGGKTVDEVKPDPKVNFKTTAGYTFASATVAGDSIVKAGILINHEYKIKKVLFQVTVAGSTFTVKDSAMSSKVVDMNFIRQVISTPGTEGWTITATDENDKTASASFTLTVVGPDPALLPHDPTPPQKGIQIYNVKDPSAGNPSAFDLTTLTPESASGADNVKDILDANTATGTAAYIAKWTSKTGTQFVKVTSSSLTYANATKYSEIVTYFNQNTAGAVTTTNVIAANDLYILKSGENGEYFLISIINVVDVANTQAGDHIEFKFKAKR